MTIAFRAAAICCLLISILLFGAIQGETKSVFCKCYEDCYNDCRHQGNNTRHADSFVSQSAPSQGLRGPPPTVPVSASSSPSVAWLQLQVSEASLQRLRSVVPSVQSASCWLPEFCIIATYCRGRLCG
jgi:hypothetical protein